MVLCAAGPDSGTDNFAVLDELSFRNGVVLEGEDTEDPFDRYVIADDSSNIYRASGIDTGHVTGSASALCSSELPHLTHDTTNSTLQPSSLPADGPKGTEVS